jgi:hypothetical protein
VIIITKEVFKLAFTSINSRKSAAAAAAAAAAHPGSINANNHGYSGSGRVTFGNDNRSVYLQGQLGGGCPNVAGMVDGHIRF